MVEALDVYKKANKSLPEFVFIYRDGLGGPTMQTKVQEKEVE